MAECNQPGCERTAQIRGACQQHYDRFMKGRDIEVPLLDSYAVVNDYRTLDAIKRDPTFAKYNPDGWPWERTGQTPKEWSDEWYAKHPPVESQPRDRGWGGGDSTRWNRR